MLKNGEILDENPIFQFKNYQNKMEKEIFLGRHIKPIKKYKIKSIHCAVFINVNKLIHIIGRFCGEIASHTTSNVLSVGMQKVHFIAER